MPSNSNCTGLGFPAFAVLELPAIPGTCVSSAAAGICAFPAVAGACSGSVFAGLCVLGVDVLGEGSRNVSYALIFNLSSVRFTVVQRWLMLCWYRVPLR